jgi:hypothetical protein
MVDFNARKDESEVGDREAVILEPSLTSLGMPKGPRLQKNKSLSLAERISLSAS